jgi:hypothetical protein
MKEDFETFAEQLWGFKDSAEARVYGTHADILQELVRTVEKVN